MISSDREAVQALALIASGIRDIAEGLDLLVQMLGEQIDEASYGTMEPDDG